MAGDPEEEARLVAQSRFALMDDLHREVAKALDKADAGDALPDSVRRDPTLAAVVARTFDRWARLAEVSAGGPDERAVRYRELAARLRKLTELH